MRYEKRWANGYWRIFDTVTYSTVELCNLSVDADERLAKVFNKA